VKCKDWADKKAAALKKNIRLLANDGSPADSVYDDFMPKQFRSAERRGFRRAVRLLRDRNGNHVHRNIADWLAEQEKAK
jgi:hypothetical protein